MWELETLRHDYRRVRSEIRRLKALAPAACKALLAEPRDLQVERVRRSYSRYGTRPVVEELLRRSLAAASSDAEASYHLGRLAQEAVKKIVGREHLAGGEKAIPDLNALVRAHLGNASRILRRFDEAEQHFQNALVFAVQGSGDSYVFGEVYSFYSSLLRCRRELKGALTFLEKAKAAYGILGDDIHRAKILLQRALVLEDMREGEEALAAIQEALPLLGGASCRRLRANAYHHMAFLLCELDRTEEAEDAYERSEDLFRRLRVNSKMVANHRAWVHGKVCLGLGELELAEEVLGSAQDGFRLQQDPYRCALTSLDLAGVYAQQGRLEALAVLVVETYESLKSLSLGPEAERAMQLLLKSAQRRQVTLAVLRAAAAQLRGYLTCWGPSR